MESRKQKEIEYYDEKAKERLGKESRGDFEGFNPFLVESYEFLYRFLQDKCRGKKILDYGCGDGIHSIWLAKAGGQVVGIDLSEKSLEIAKEKAMVGDIAGKAEFLIMDCEKMEFPDNSFDIVFDGGTFSSLDLNRALPELIRVLKPEGFLVGIETLGHNPLINLKRKINILTGKRTRWAASHIFKIEDLKKAERYFDRTESHFFHLISWLAFPFLNLPGGKIMLRLLEKIDHLFLAIFPFLKRYSFKAVFIFYGKKVV